MRTRGSRKSSYTTECMTCMANKRSCSTSATPHEQADQRKNVSATLSAAVAFIPFLQCSCVRAVVAPLNGRQLSLFQSPSDLFLADGTRSSATQSAVDAEVTVEQAAPTPCAR